MLVALKAIERAQAEMKSREGRRRRRRSVAELTPYNGGGDAGGIGGMGGGGGGGGGWMGALVPTELIPAELRGAEMLLPGKVGSNRDLDPLHSGLGLFLHWPPLHFLTGPQKGPRMPLFEGIF